MNSFSDEKLVMLAKEGNDLAFQEISGRLKETVKIKASSYYIDGGDRDDLLQEGMIGLFKAVKDFDESKDIKFRTFAGICIDRQIVSAVRKASSVKNEPLNKSVPIPDEDYVEARGHAMSAEEIVFSKITAEDRYDKLLTALSDLEKRVLVHLLDGKTYKEIAAAESISEKASDNAIQRIKRKAKDSFE